MELLVVLALGAVAFVGGLALVIGLVVWLLRSDRAPGDSSPRARPHDRS